MKKEKTQLEYQLEEQKLQEILLLLDQLFRREEVTAQSIVGCLYDIATINLINKYCPFWGINPLLKYLTRFPRPLAKSLGVKLYLQTKCPKLITDWLYGLVEFPPAKPIETPVEVIESSKQVKSLQNQVKLLTGALVTSIAIFSGGFFWIAQNLELNPLELLIIPDKTLSTQNHH
jgi:hypothetical protein